MVIQSRSDSTTIVTRAGPGSVYAMWLLDVLATDHQNATIWCDWNKSKQHINQ